MKKATVLIVEDEALLNEAYELVLRKSGFNTLSAYNGFDALKILQNNEVNLMLLDLRMPTMSGLELLKKMDKKLKSKTKIVVFSNYDVQKDINKAFELGATKYMLKSWVSPKELVKFVNDTLKIQKP